MSQDSTIRRSVLTGEEMAALLAVVPADVSPGVAWPVLRTGTGLLLGVAWRYLVPHE